MNASADSWDAGRREWFVEMDALSVKLEENVILSSVAEREAFSVKLNRGVVLS